MDTEIWIPKAPISWLREVMHGYKHIFAQFDIEVQFSHFFYHNMNVVHMVRNYSSIGNYIIQTQLYKKKT